MDRYRPRGAARACTMALAVLLGCFAPMSAVPGPSAAAPHREGPVLPGPSSPASGPSGVPIPSTGGEAPAFQGSPASPRPVPARPVPHDPFLAVNGRSSMHDDAYASDAYQTAGPLGRRIRVRSSTYGIEECATMAFDRSGRIEALCGGAEGPRLMLLDPRTLDVLAAQPLPPRQVRPGTSPLEDLCGGAYFYLDNRDRAVVATTNAQVWVVGQATTPAGPTFRLLRRYDLGRVVPGGDCLVALLPDWHGLVWFVTEGGGVGTLDRRTGRIRSVRLPGERIVNSFATDESGGVFVVSDHAAYRFDAGGGGRPVVTWRRRYDRGAERKPGQLSRGSGTTPTLVGRHLVAITDNADPRMHVVVLDRRTGHRVCAQPVFRRGASDTENSLVAVGRSIVAENNYGYTGPASVTNGRSTAPGVTRVRIGRRGCSTLWTSAERAPTSVPKASLASGLLCVYAKPAGVRSDPWYFTALDLRSGRTVCRLRTGSGPAWNNHYAAIYLGPDGSAFLATLGGVMRITDAAR